MVIVNCNNKHEIFKGVSTCKINQSWRRNSSATCQLALKCVQEDLDHTVNSVYVLEVHDGSTSAGGPLPNL